MEQISLIIDFVVKSFIHIWPYLLITIPLAVIAKLSGISKYITLSFNKKPVISIILATLVGALSPFCSCGVIPVIASLLIGGVPLAPVMSFWIASPSMDPEIFFLSVGTIGLQLSIWRLVATFAISLFAGFLVYFAQKKGWLGDSILRARLKTEPENEKSTFLNLSFIKRWIHVVNYDRILKPKAQPVVNHATNRFANQVAIDKTRLVLADKGTNGSLTGCSCNTNTVRKSKTLLHKIIRESWKASLMVAKFMLLAFFLNAMIAFYVHDDFLVRFLGNDHPFAILISAALGVPVYTSNLTALPIIGGLIKLGMGKGAALAFLITGPVTTIPAMSAVWGLVKPRIFLIYISVAFMGALFFGYLYSLVNLVF